MEQNTHTPMRNHTLHTFIRNNWNLAYLLLLSAFGFYFCLGQAAKMADHGHDWWFQGLLSCSHLFLFYVIAITGFDAIKTVLTDSKTAESKGTGVSARQIILQKLYFNAAYCTVISIFLFPLLADYGVSWLNLIATYLYCIGFYNIGLTPLILSQERENISHFPAISFMGFRKVLPLICIVLLIGIYTCIEELWGETSPQTARIVLSALGIAGILLHRPLAKLFTSIYEKQ